MSQLKPLIQKPGDYPRRILLAVSGLSPQIVTETLYALATDTDTPFVPTEIHIITTREGANRAQLALLSPDMGWFDRLCKDYHLPPIAFTAEHIHIMRDASGAPMDDIRSPADNQACADFITEKVRAFSEDAQSALHVSIAGGRKTMGFYLGYALSLYGRAQDRLSHVLVSEPFESTYDFFYPTPYSRVLQTGDGKLADTATAQVTLAQIPFVSLRNDLPVGLLSGRASFSETVAAAQAALADPILALDLRGRCIQAGNKIIQLPPAELALLAVFARRALASEPALAAPPKSLPDMAWQEMFMHEYRLIGKRKSKEEQEEEQEKDPTEVALKNGLEGEYFSQHKSKLEKLMKTALGPAAGAYRIDNGGKRPYRYSLTLSADAIHFTCDLSPTLSA